MRDQDVSYAAPVRLRDQACKFKNPQILSGINSNLRFLVLYLKCIIKKMPDLHFVFSNLIRKVLKI